MQHSELKSKDSAFVAIVILYPHEQHTACSSHLAMTCMDLKAPDVLPLLALPTTIKSFPRKLGTVACNIA